MLKQLNFVWFKPFILPTNRIKWTIQNTQFIFTVSREEAKNPFNKKSTWITREKIEPLYQFHHALISLFSRCNKYLRNKNSFNFRCITFYLHIKLNSTMKRWEQQNETKSGARIGQRWFLTRNISLSADILSVWKIFRHIIILTIKFRRSISVCCIFWAASSESVCTHVQVLHRPTLKHSCKYGNGFLSSHRKYCSNSTIVWFTESGSLSKIINLLFWMRQKSENCLSPNFEINFDCSLHHVFTSNGEHIIDTHRSDRHIKYPWGRMIAEHNAVMSKLIQMFSSSSLKLSNIVHISYAFMFNWIEEIHKYSKCIISTPLYPQIQSKCWLLCFGL